MSFLTKFLTIFVGKDSVEFSLITQWRLRLAITEYQRLTAVLSGLQYVSVNPCAITVQIQKYVTLYSRLAAMIAKLPSRWPSKAPRSGKQRIRTVGHTTGNTCA